MKCSLKVFLPENTCYCELDNLYINGILIENERDVQTFFQQLLYKSKLYPFKLGIAKSGIDLIFEQTIQKNLKYKGIDALELASWQKQCDFAFSETVQNVSLLNQCKVRLIFALVHADVVYIDEFFTNQLTEEECFELCDFIQQVQYQEHKLIVLILQTANYGKYCTRLHALVPTTSQFLPLK